MGYYVDMQSTSGYLAGRLYIEERGVDINNNTSRLYVAVQVRKVGTTKGTTGTWYGQLSIGSQSWNISKYCWINTDWVEIDSWESNNIKHNDDGSKKVWVSAWCNAPDGTTLANQYVEKGLDVTLTTIARASTINAFNGSDITGNFNATFTAKSSSFKHKLRISIPGVVALQTFDNYTNGANVTLNNTALNTLHSKMTNKNTITLGAVIETYNGSTKVGESAELSHTCTWYRGRIKINGTWRKAQTFIKVNGSWKDAVPYEKVNGTWKYGV